MWIGIVAGAFLVIFVGMSAYWRYSARKTNAPCPVWLSWMLSPGGSERPFGRGGAIDALELKPGMRVVDVGCGPGILTLPLARAVAPDGEVVALDLQQGMLDRMTKRLEKAELTNVKPLLAGAGTGALPENTFDRALLSTVLGEIPDREGALHEIFAALKPGGYLVVAEVMGDPHYQFKKKVIDLATATGFTPGEVTGGFFAYTIRLYRPQ